MEKLIKNPNVLMVGAGVLTFLAVRWFLNRNAKSSFDGDGVNNFEPTSGYDGDGVNNFEPTSGADAFEPSSEVCGGCGA